MELLKKIASPLQKLFSSKTSSKSSPQLTTFGCMLELEARRKKRLLQEQQSNQSK